MATTTFPLPLSLSTPEPLTVWNGGENFYDGPHDEFCFVCGSTMSLIACQTCENCYHIECMSPSPSPESIPAFWFCPHCVGREWHLPPLESMGEDSQALDGTAISGFEEGLRSKEKENQLPVPEEIVKEGGIVVPQSKPKRKFDTALDRAIYHPPASEPITKRAENSPSSNLSKPASSSSSSKLPPNSNLSPSTNTNPPQKRTLSPPPPPSTSIPPHTKKRSKYSTFSSEVDRALSIIHSELETAAGISGKESSLRERVKALEQEVRVKEGECLLLRGEKEGIGNEMERLKGENMRLKGLVDEKERELSDWRARLRGLVGE